MEIGESASGGKDFWGELEEVVLEYPLHNTCMRLYPMLLLNCIDLI